MQLPDSLGQLQLVYILQYRAKFLFRQVHGLLGGVRGERVRAIVIDVAHDEFWDFQDAIGCEIARVIRGDYSAGVNQFVATTTFVVRRVTTISTL